MDFVPYAVPFFIALIVVELLVDRWRGARNYRVADAINSLSTGVLSTTTGLLTKGVGLLTYAFALKHLALTELSAQSAWTWVSAFVFYDFCYYWLHRMGHERNILWAAHSVHHQSEDCNLTTALRQTSTGFLLSWIFYLPLAVLGVPLMVFISVVSLNLLYQFWVHTRHVPKLGWFEWFFVTPSNHRAHHAQNALYMDRNYGGVFIFWDRLFGTFQEEDDNEPVIFGVTTPLASWNPLWANLQFYAQLWSDARRTESRRDGPLLLQGPAYASGVLGVSTGSGSAARRALASAHASRAIRAFLKRRRSHRPTPSTSRAPSTHSSYFLTLPSMPSSTAPK
ncbi:C-5 sterol desaturase [Pseudomonas orientalis]|nr:C-5 sterol desaturase [Pseudomonas orientalis]AZF02585.1 C-5 sterol desaturase [Pseudomonas orientalis]